MQQEGFFANIVGMFSLALYNLMGFTVVDNTVLCMTYLSSTAAAVPTHMQGSITTWEGLLQATWGVLVPDKHFWYLLDFGYRQGKWVYNPFTSHQELYLCTTIKANNYYSEA